MESTSPRTRSLSSISDLPRRSKSPPGLHLSSLSLSLPSPSSSSSSLSSSSHRTRILSRYDYDGPAWFERVRSGYNGLAWYDITTSQHPHSNKPAEKGLEEKGRKQGRVKEICDLGIPRWLDLEREEHIAAYVFGRLYSKRRRPHSAYERLASYSQGEESCNDSTMNGVETKRDTIQDSRDIKTEEERVRELRIAMGKARRAKERLKERLKHGAEMVATGVVTDQEYRLPRTLAMLEAKEVSEQVQSSAIRRNWFLIKRSFDQSGGVLSLNQLRQTLLAVGLSLPHTGRVVLKASQTLLPGEDLVAYQDFHDQYFETEDQYETDSDIEDFISVCMDEQDQSDQSDSYQVELEGEQVFTEQIEQGMSQAVEQSEMQMKMMWESKDLIEPEKPSADSMKRKTTIMQPPRHWELEELSNESPVERHKRKVVRIKKKIKAAMKTKGMAVGGSEGLSVDDVLDIAGHSLVHLKLIDRDWIKSRPTRKSSVMIHSLGSPRGTMSSFGGSFMGLHPNSNNRPPFPLPIEECVDVSKLGHLDALDHIGAQRTLAHVVSLIQAVSSLQLQRVVRGYIVRSNARYYFQEAVLAKHIKHRADKLIEKWFVVSRRQFLLREHALRYLVHWRRIVRNVLAKREIFRCCFWPFFVWRRYAFQRINARNKAKFLKRVWRTYVLLRHIKAWRQETRRSRAVAEKALQCFFSRVKDTVRLQFFAWRDFTKHQVLLREKWASSGQAIRHRVLKRLQLRLWTAWRLVAKGSQVCRHRSLKYYNHVPYLFIAKQRFVRKELQMPQRHYKEVEKDPVPEFPSLYELVGDVGTALLRSDSKLKKLCKEFWKQLVEADRVGRIHNCIQRNQLCPLVFSIWRDFVEERQKERYAWFHFVKRMQQQAFGAWKNSVSFTAAATVRVPTTRRRAASVASPSDEVILVAGSSPKSVSRRASSVSISTERSTRRNGIAAAVSSFKEKTIAASKTSAPVQTEAEIQAEKQARLAQEKREIARIRAEREKSHEQWIKDRKWRQQNLDRYTKEVKGIREQRLGRSAKLEAHEERLRMARENARRSEVEVDRLLASKTEEVEESKRLQVEHAQKLHNMRGRLLHDAMCSVIQQVEDVRAENLVKHCFRMLRFPVMAKKSFGLLQRKRLKNWVRICVRLRKLWRAMPKFRALRIKWDVFNKWLCFLDEKYMYESPGLRETLARRQELFRKYSAFIRQVGEENATKNGLAGWFLRWVEFGQKSVLRRQLISLQRKRLDLRLLQRVLSVWRTQTRPRYSLEERCERECFVARRHAFDLDRYKHKLLVLEKSLLTTKIWRRNHFVASKTRQGVLGDYSDRLILKRVLERHKHLTVARLDLEKRLLCTAFEERGTFVFQDAKSGTVGLDLSEMEGGSWFQDPSCGPAVGVHSVLVGVSDGMVVSLQLKMRSGTREAPKFSVSRIHGFRPRGLSTGTGQSRHGEDDTAFVGDDSNGGATGGGLVSEPGFEVFEFVLEDFSEKLECIEGYAMEHVVGGKLRFRTNKGRVSPWYGRGERGAKFRLPSAREKNKFGKNRFVEEFIIGFFGAESETSILSLGAVVRQVDQTNVFSRCWLDRVDTLADDVPEGESPEEQQAFIEAQKAQHERQFAYVLAMRCAHVDEVLARSIRFALRLRYDNSTPRALSSVHVVSALLRWTFNSWSHSLVKLPALDDSQLAQRGRETKGEKNQQGEDNNIAQGYMLVNQGNTRLKIAKTRKIELEDLLSTGEGINRRRLNEADISLKRFRELSEELARQEMEIQLAKELISRGRSIIDQGLFEMPKLNTSVEGLKYYENLVRLAIIKDQIGS